MHEMDIWKGNCGTVSEWKCARSSLVANCCGNTLFKNDSNYQNAKKERQFNEERQPLILEIAKDVLQRDSRLSVSHCLFHLSGCHNKASLLGALCCFLFYISFQQHVQLSTQCSLELLLYQVYRSSFAHLLPRKLFFQKGGLQQQV